ncbi:DUF3152 domain-containing protein [Streptomyces phaeoluteigriseus]|uniref:DUF3152 domain-containing protein n=1 Tax=Streptomyces phaeoluteigriseus TaxID=114686 RepID=A0ABY4Z2V6_9ACTN|nr:DUF3152 domain-containing protein [Streptomyces phaeoluteigriseus]USQ83354.1 DUF3152 domain-containing protein [Streptomyces phaeoluteigriseus]
MGRHSRRGSAPKNAPQQGTGGAAPEAVPGEARGGPPQGEARPAAGPSAKPGYPDGTPARGLPRLADGTPARGLPRLPDGTPAHGLPVPGGRRTPEGTPPHGTPQVRGGHPEQREAGGAWGALKGRTASGSGPLIPRQRPESAAGSRQRRTDSAAGPRQDYLDAFTGDDDVFARRVPVAAAAVTALATDPYVAPRPTDAYVSVTDWDRNPRPTPAGGGAGGADGEPPTGEPAARGGKGRAFTGIAAAAVTTVLAIVVAGQVTDARDDDSLQSQSTADKAARDARDATARDAERPSPSASPSVVQLTYDQKMTVRYPLGATFAGSGKFDAVPGIDKAPGKGQKYTYRVDVEQGIGLDGAVFAQAVQKTLNDDRSWAHNGARTFERIHSGEPDFVITLASPGTTAEWCAKSGLDTTEDNVSCDSAATERVMINAYRWAQGSQTYGDQMYAYRQMLINHEVGHRLGYGHVTCDKDGDLAPVMQQQTKFLEYDGIRCLPNPWPYPNS